MRKRSGSILNLVVLLSMVLSAFAAPTAAAAAPAPAPAQQATESGVTIEPQLQQKLNADATTGYLIYFKETPDLSSAYLMDWNARGVFVMKTLQDAAEKSQERVRAYLDSQGTKYQAFWIENVISVEKSSAKVVSALMGYPEIESLRAHRVLGIIEPEVVPLTEAELKAVEPNIAHVGAPDVWAEGFTGQNVVVSSIDTGVRYTHQALVGKYRGNLGGGTFEHNYNWYDPYGDHPTSPGDDNGHGSHTMGTTLGDDGGANQIGMAPGAKWLACRGCNTSSCTDAALLSCAQFIAAPTNLAGASPDPSKRPNVVNNSWGDCSQSYDPWYRTVVDAWQAAGIYPVFSNGNASNCGYSTPPGLNTVGNPARYGNVTGVGSSGTNNGQYATHSNWGPTDNPDTINPAGYPNLKPQVIAPGVNIRSSVNTSDTAYQGGWSGTSMSAPHVTGLTALIMSAAPCLVGHYAEVETIIQETATAVPYASGGTPPPGPGNVPNYATGWGEINALAAVNMAKTMCGPQGGLQGVITNEDTAAPIMNAVISATSSPTNTVTAKSGADGSYKMTLGVGTYSVTASAYAFLPETVTGIEVTEDVTTTLSFQLNPAPSYAVSGVVTDATTGWPLYAKIVVEGAPIDPIWTNPATGAFSINLLGGSTYTFHVTNFWGGYSEAVVPVGPLTAPVTQNVALSADLQACTAPGYVQHGLNESFSGTTVPAGWTVKHISGACDWVFNDPGSRGNLTGGTGNFAIADSDNCGSGTTMNSELYSPIVDVSTLSSIVLSFKYDYNNLVATEVAAVDVSANGGATWTNVVNWGATDMRGPATFTQDVTSLLSGATQAQIRFRYVAPGWDWWWEVDDVFMGAHDCAPQAGGLVVGNVKDLNTNLPLLGATVSSDAGGSTHTVATPLDPAVTDAFYTLFQPSGAHNITASQPQYASDTANVTVPAGGTVGQDFALGAGILTYTPASLSASVSGGVDQTLPFTITNSGSVAATFSITEVDGSFLPYRAGEDNPTAINAAMAWADESPTSGTINPGQTQVVNVTFHANVTPGIYHGQLSFTSNTPYAVPNMPVDMTASIPPTWGKVTGMVSTLGACDANPAALASQTVNIKSFDGTTWTPQTNALGVYTQWIDGVHSPVTVTVNLAGYQPGVYTNVPVVGGQTETRDFTLRAIAPCMSVAPPSLTVNLGLGESTSRQVRLSNSGAGAGNFTATESNGSFTPLPRDEARTTAEQPGLFELAGPAVEKASGPYHPDADVNLIVDDGTLENSIGLTAGGDFIWVNRFTPAADLFPFTLNSVSMVFDTFTPTGSAIELVVFEDPDGNLSNGATFLYSQNVTVLSNDGATWNVYNLTTPVTLNGPGDVIIGAVNRGPTAVGQYPAGIDQSSTLQRRSWIGLYSGSVPEPPTLPADDTWGIIDDLSATLAGNWMIRGAGTTGGGVPFNLDWVSETPTTGVVPADSFQWVSINFDASKVAQPGTYKAVVTYGTNDTLHDELPVNVTMNVNASALWGVLQGQVDGMTRCDAGQAPLSGATVIATGTDGVPYQLATGSDGKYLVWLPSSASPFTVVASKDGYIQASVSGIIVNDAGEVTTAPTLALRLNSPCVDAAPPALSITLPWGGTGSLPLSLTNTGPVASTFEIGELPGSFFPMAPNALSFLIVGSSGTNVTAIQAALTAMGATSTLVSTTAFNALTLAQLKAYSGVIWTTSLPPGSTSIPPMQVYLDSGGRLMVFYNDFGYSWRSTAAPNFFTTYFESLYGADAGSDGPIVGADLLAGINVDISGDPYPDSFISLGADAVSLFDNTAPRTGSAGVRVTRNGYRIAYFGFLFNYVTPAASQATIMQKVVKWVTAADVPWLSEAPTNGTLPANTGNVPVTVSFNAADASITQPGTYTAGIVVSHQDTGRGDITVPVTMTVTPSATQGKLEGIISGLLYCDGVPGTPLSDASVQITGGAGISVTVKTDAAGHFQRWLEAGTYTLNVSATGYQATSVASVAVTGGATTTQDVALRWLKPCVSADPTSLSATVDLGTSTTLPLNLTNTGPAATTFKINEAAGGFFPTGTNAGGDFLVVNDSGAADAAAFEATLTALGYTYDEVTYTVFTGMSVSDLLAYKAVLYGGVISSGSEQTKAIEYLDAGGKLLVASNDLGYFYSSSVFYSTYLEAQWTGLDSGSDGTVTGADIMAGINIDISSDPYPDSFTIIGTHAVPIFNNNAPNTNLAGLRIERNNYQAVYLSWNFQYTGGTSNTADKIAVLGRALGWLAPSVDIPWLSESPITGTLAADTGAQVVNVTLDAAAVDQPGTYYAGLKVKTDDPQHGIITVPVTMTVPVADGLGKLIGTVRTLGACDIHPAALADAAIQLTDGITVWNTTSGAAGYWQEWLPEGTYTITVAAPEHQTLVVPGVAVTEEVTTTQNLDLRWIKSCVTADPDSLEATVSMGMSTTEMLTLINSGLLTGTFEITASSDWFIPSRPAGGLSLPFRAGDTIQTAPAQTVTIGDTTIGKAAKPATQTKGQTALPNAPEDSLTITESASQSIISGNSVSCNASGITAENSYLRVFDLPTFGIADDFTISQIQIGIEDAVAGGTNQPMDVRLYTLNGTLVWANLTQIGSASVTITDQALTILTVPVTGVAPAGSKLVVEIHIPDGAPDGNTFFIGSNNLGQTAPSYLAAADCGLAEPATTDSIGFPEMQIVMNVTGETGGGGGGGIPAPDFLSATPLDGIIAPNGSTVPVTVTFDASQVVQPGTYTGHLDIETNTPVTVPLVVPVTMTVPAPATYAKLKGTVTDMGYCDANPVPLEDAQVVIQGTTGTYTVTTDADGYYQLWMPVTEAPLTVVASAGSDFVPKTALDVALSATTPTTVDFSLRELEPCVSTTPASLSVDVVRGGAITVPLSLKNNGAQGTDYLFTETNGGFVPGVKQPMPRTLRTPESGKSPASKPTTILVFPTRPRAAVQTLALINDGSFEGTAWTEWDNTGCTPWIGDWESYLGFPAYDGVQYLWAGGACGSPNSNYAEQSITLPADAGNLTFWYQASRVDPDDAVNGLAYVKINGTSIWSLEMSQANNTTAWTQQTVDISAYAGQTVMLRLGADNPGAGIGNVAFDYIEVAGGGGGGGGGAVPWLTEVPVTGTLAADSTNPADMIFDSSLVTQTGRYTATLTLKTDDPQHPDLNIPVTMNVIVPSYSVEATAPQLTLIGDRGTWVTFNVTVENTGNDPYGDIFEASFTGNQWLTEANPASVALLPGESAVVAVRVFIPAGVIPGSADHVIARFQSVTDSAAFTTLNLTTIARSFAPTLTPATDAKSGPVGGKVVYTLHLVNNADYTETFNLAVSGNAWTTNLSQSAIVLAAGASIDFTVEVNILATALYGDTDVATVTVTSLSDPTKFATTVLTTTAVKMQIFLPAIMLKTPAQ